MHGWVRMAKLLSAHGRAWTEALFFRKVVVAWHLIPPWFPLLNYTPNFSFSISICSQISMLWQWLLSFIRFFHLINSNVGLIVAYFFCSSFHDIEWSLFIIIIIFSKKFYCVMLLACYCASFCFLIILVISFPVFRYSLVLIIIPFFLSFFLFLFSYYYFLFYFFFLLPNLLYKGAPNIIKSVNLKFNNGSNFYHATYNFLRISFFFFWKIKMTTTYITYISPLMIYYL